MVIQHFNTPWHAVPTVWIDTETTGVRFGTDKAVEVGFARFEAGRCVGEYRSLVQPGIPIPPESALIHNITDEDVALAPRIEDVFAETEVCELLEGAQPAGYNCPFDRQFLPPFGDWMWPWLDCLTLVRGVDRFAKGAGRHKLTVACERHGILLGNAHSALADAKASGELFYKIGMENLANDMSLGSLLKKLRVTEADEWFRFNEWRSRQESNNADR